MTSGTLQVSADAHSRASFPWDIGHHQKVLESVVHMGLVKGRILDIGCGAGWNAIFLSKLGYEVLGVDRSPVAIAAAERATTEQATNCSFVAIKAAQISTLQGKFDTVIDFAFLQVLSPDERTLHLAEVREKMVEGGHYILVCFKKSPPLTPIWIDKSEIRGLFTDGWTLKDICATTYEIRSAPGWQPAWLGLATKTS